MVKPCRIAGIDHVWTHDMLNHNGIKWIDYHGALIPDVAPHISIDITDQDMRFLLRTSKAYLLRWHTEFDGPPKTDFWHVIKDRPYDILELSKNMRNQIRKGLRHCTIRKIDAAYLAKAGYPVYRNAMKSYKTDLQILDEKEFQENLCRMADNNDFEFWGVWSSENNLIAYSQIKIQDGSCNYQVIKLDPQYLKLYSGYALIHTMNHHYLEERKCLYVNDGARNIRHDTGIQDFLIKKFGFRKAFSKLHVVYCKKIGWGLRILYPFRSIVFGIPGSLFEKASILLRQEEIRKSFDNNPA